MKKLLILIVLGPMVFTGQSPAFPPRSVPLAEQSIPSATECCLRQQAGGAGKKDEYSFKWSEKPDTALVYDTHEGGRPGKKFLLFSSELVEPCSTSIPVASFNDIPIKLVFSLPEKPLKKAGKFDVEYKFFEECGFADQGGNRSQITVSGTWGLMSVGKRKIGKTEYELANFKGIFNISEIKVQGMSGKADKPKIIGSLNIDKNIDTASSRIISTVCAYKTKSYDLDASTGFAAEKKIGTDISFDLAGETDVSKENKSLVESIDKAIAASAKFLRSKQKPDGSFLGDKFGGAEMFKLGQTAVATMALIHSGAKIDDPAIKKAFEFMRDAFKKTTDHLTYDVALLLMALETKYFPLNKIEDVAKFSEEDVRKELKDKVSKEDIQLASDAVGWLVKTQTQKGTWGYNTTQNQYNDNSNTQYAALGLKSAARMGVAVPNDVLKKTAQYFLDTQSVESEEIEVDITKFGEAKKDEKQDGKTDTKKTKEKESPGGWKYFISTPPGMPAGGFADLKYAAMTCAGLSSLIICQSELSFGKGLDKDLNDKIEKARKRGLAWIQKYFTVRANVPGGHFFTKFYLYYLYSIERVSVLHGIQKYGVHNWYFEGAELLINSQNPDGSWISQDGLSISDTALGLLFLKRATIPVGIVETGK